MDIGVRELKQNLSAVLERVSRGETVRVTDRGVPKAVLSPITDEAGLERGIDEGWVRPATRRGLEPARRVRSSSTIRDALAEDRYG